MRFLTPHWYTRHLEEIIAVFQTKNHTVLPYQNTPRNFHYDPVFRKDFTQTVTEQDIEGVFSLQYFPILSNLCEKLNIPYICWCTSDQNNQLLLTKSVTNDCNIIFHTDSGWAEKLQRIGVRNIFYLPWGASRKQMTDINPLPHSSAPQTDISLVDTSEPEAWLQYLTLAARLDRRTKGFLDGLLQAQQSIYGCHLLEKVLGDRILTALQTALPLSGAKDTIAPPETLYALQLLYPAVTKRETDSLLQLLEKETSWKTAFYTTSDSEKLQHITQRELPTDSAEALAIYTDSKINLLAAPREIQNAVPVQAMDIMGQGGFLLTNFQNDYLRFFEPGRDFVYYESPEDMLDKARYYLRHEEERQQIASHAYHNIMEKHTLDLRIQEMLSQLNLA